MNSPRVPELLVVFSGGVKGDLQNEVLKMISKDETPRAIRHDHEVIHEVDCPVQREMLQRIANALHHTFGFSASIYQGAVATMYSPRGQSPSPIYAAKSVLLLEKHQAAPDIAA